MTTHTLPWLRPACWPWPLPALCAWAGSWLAWWVFCSWHHGLGFAAGVLTGSLFAWACAGRWRQFIAVLGFPLSAWALGAATAWPAWAWLALLLPLLLAYPLRAWRDAPLFPTPANALNGLDRAVGTPQRALDAGCGLGHGLRALHALWPHARLSGVEWSPLLAVWARLRCPWARVQRGDMWGMPWSSFDLVYVFQRPESMARVWAKAQLEMVAGTWLVSLEFAVQGVAPSASVQVLGQRPLWLYRLGETKAHSTKPGHGR